MREVEVSAEVKDKRLNRAVALTVFCRSSPAGNIMTAISSRRCSRPRRTRSQLERISAIRTKLHISKPRAARSPCGQPRRDHQSSKATLAQLDADIANIAAKRQAEGQSRRKPIADALNVHDDQFDASGRPSPPRSRWLRSQLAEARAVVRILVLRRVRDFHGIVASPNSASTLTCSATPG